MATAFVMGMGALPSHSATVNLAQGLPPGVILDRDVEDAWWGEWKGRANVPAMQEALEGLGGKFTDVNWTAPLKLDGLSGGQETVFTYEAEARTAFAIKSGGLWTAILFSAPTTNWTITGLDHEISQLVGFNGDTISPIPLPPAAILFLTGLLGMGFLGRRRDWRPKKID